ncbi:hypothetical protein NUACC21_72180 [Scytonema sp. NUACC21]
MKTFAYHAEDEKAVSKHRGIDAVATALKRVHLSEMGSNQWKHQFKEVEKSLKILLATEPIRGFVETKTQFVQSEFESIDTQWLNLTNTRIVKFRQKYRDIPVYGAQVVVEVDEQNELLAINSAIGEPNGINASPQVKPDEIKHIIEGKKGYKLPDLDLNPTLYYYYDSKKGSWRLVYITDIIFKDSEKYSQSQFLMEMVDYVIDAHTKEIVLELPRVRTLKRKMR